MRFQDLVKYATLGFPVWALAAGLLALFRPEIFTWFSGGRITVGLGAIMLCMGLTLEVDDFRRVLQKPRIILLGVALQYTVMPAMGWTVAAIAGLPVPFAVGLILVSCCPGGVASNVICYLAMADVPLSVSLTAVSTAIAALMTPSLTTLLAGSRVDVPSAGLLWSTVQVVVIPIALGLVLQRFARRFARAILPVAPLVSVVLITLIVASIIGASRDAIIESGVRLLIAVFALHSMGFLLGYVLTKTIWKDKIASRTVSIEVGMQNSGLGVVLARQNFADPLTAAPSAVSSLFHSLIASVLAAIWRRQFLR
jgi:BASS family bile acid:Na+ symporter